MSNLVIQKKRNRNVKGLQLADEAAKPGTLAQPRGHQRLNLSTSSTRSSDPSSPSAPSSAFSSASSRGRRLSEQLAHLELGIEFKLDLRAEDLEMVNEVGAGNGGTVSKVKHLPTGAIMARKVVHIDAKPSVRKQIVRELQIMHDCASKYIVSFYGAYLADPHICMCMELMDKGSLDSIYKAVGPIPENVLGKIAVAVVSGLTYLYDAHRIIHRDVKPSNILLNSAGQIKICDFGVSGELINSVADTFVGTSTYMSPERIQGAAYTVKSDVWSLGISLIEVALGRFPFSEDDSDDEEEPTLSPVRPQAREHALAGADARRAARRSATVQNGSISSIQPLKPKPAKPKKAQNGGGALGGMSILELLQHVVNEPAPRLPEGRFRSDTNKFIDACLEKDVTRRPTPKELRKFEWFLYSDGLPLDLEAWAATLPCT